MGQKLIHLSILLILIIQSSYAAVLSCNFASGPCYVDNITDVTAANEQISIAGKPAGFIDTSTYSLSFATPSNLFYVPTSLFTTFPNIQSFDMYKTSLNTLVTDAFANAGNLISISIYDNNFPDLPASFCSSCINVTSLNMMTNNINNLDNDALKGLKFLNNIILRGNKISCIPPGFFQNTPVINSIDLAENQITTFDRMTFTGLPNLYSISLSSNKIASIPDFDLTLTGMSMGISFMMENNPVMAIHPQFLTHLYSSRSGYMSVNINLYDSYGNTTTCLPKNNMYTSSISGWSWAVANISLDDCYANWTPELELTPVSCAPPSTDSTTTTTEKSGGSDSGENHSGENFRGWGLKKNFFAIISNAMRNFTANVQFQ